MYQNIVNQNPLLNQFNGYMTQNPNIIPFQNNSLINNNVHVMNNLNDYVKQHKVVQQNIPTYQQQLQNHQINQTNQMNQMNQINQTNQIDKTNQINKLSNKQSNGKIKNVNIIEEMLKPQKITKDNKDVDSNYRIRKDIQKNAKKGNLDIKITNAPYKNIIKDKIIAKKVEDIEEKDLVVHKSIKEIDADRKKFDKELESKEGDLEKINDELKIEFHIDNYDKHKEKYIIKETFIRNLAFEQDTFDETKEDFIEFYRKKQKEAEEGQKMCDQILHNIIDDGIISKDELPMNGDDLSVSETINNDLTNKNDIDLKSIINNIQTDESINIKTTKDIAPQENPMIKRKMAADKIIINKENNLVPRKSQNITDKNKSSSNSNPKSNSNHKSNSNSVPNIGTNTKLSNKNELSKSIPKQQLSKSKKRVNTNDMIDV